MLCCATVGQAQVDNQGRGVDRGVREVEAALENGVYSGTVTASILVDDLRVGDTIEYQYSVVGDNPVFGGKFFNGASWDQASPVERRRVLLTHPADRAIGWKLVGEGDVV